MNGHTGTGRPQGSLSPPLGRGKSPSVYSTVTGPLARGEADETPGRPSAPTRALAEVWIFRYFGRGPPSTFHYFGPEEARPWRGETSVEVSDLTANTPPTRSGRRDDSLYLPFWRAAIDGDGSAGARAQV